MDSDEAFSPALLSLILSYLLTILDPTAINNHQSRPTIACPLLLTTVIDRFPVSRTCFSFDRLNNRSPALLYPYPLRRFGPKVYTNSSIFSPCRCTHARLTNDTIIYSRYCLLKVEVFSMGQGVDPVDITKAGLARAKEEGFDTVIVDTAGRQVVDDGLMTELKNIQVCGDIAPSEVRT